MHHAFENLSSVEELLGEDRAKFASDLLSCDRPLIFRGLNCDWPAIEKANGSIESLYQYLLLDSKEAKVSVFSFDQRLGGNLAYTKDLSSYGFETRKVDFKRALTEIYEARNSPQRRHYCGSVPIDACLHDFSQQNLVSFLGPEIRPRVWLGNSAKVAAHYDVSDNLACVVSGVRKFILFPPEQISNLYIGPIDFNLAGRPASLVDFDQPDFEKHPRFREALSTALVAELHPGDAVYIPAMWWHHVESQGDFNCLVNYWWSKSSYGGSTAYEALIHGLLTISDLPEEQRKAWRSFYDHYVFRVNGDPAEHIPIQRRGVLGRMTPKLYNKIKQFLYKSMSANR